VYTDAIFNALHLPIRGLTFARPEAFKLFAVLAILLLWWLWQARSLTRSIAPLLRAIVLALFIAGIGRSAQCEAIPKGSARPVIIDASASITPQNARIHRRIFCVISLKLKSGDPAVIFATAPIEDTVGGAVTDLTSAGGCPECDPSSTNLEAALNQIAGDPNARGGPIAVVTDGWENRGDAANAVNALRAAGIQLYIFTPPGAQSIANIAMTQLSLPPALAKAEPFALGVTMMNLNAVPAAGTITVERNGQTLDQRTVTIAPGQTRFDFPVHSESAGLVNYRASFQARQSGPRHVSRRRLAAGLGRYRRAAQSPDPVTGSQRDARYLDPVVRRLGLDPTIAVADSAAWNGSPKGYDLQSCSTTSPARAGRPRRPGCARPIRRRAAARSRWLAATRASALADGRTAPSPA
jgi:hypothetical protein